HLVRTLLVGSLAAAAAPAAAAPTFTIVKPTDTFSGLTYGQWGARWWQAVFNIPVANNNPVISGGIFGDAKTGIVFATGVGGGVTLDVSIPAGTAFLFPIINTECSTFEPPPFHGDDDVSLMQCALDDTRGTGLFAVIDGQRVS